MTPIIPLMPLSPVGLTTGSKADPDLLIWYTFDKLLTIPDTTVIVVHNGDTVTHNGEVVVHNKGRLWLN